MAAPMPPTKELTKNAPADIKFSFDSLASKTEIDSGMQFEVSAASYASLDLIAATLWRRIEGLIPATDTGFCRVIFLDTPPTFAVGALEGFQAQLSNLHESFSSSRDIALQALQRLNSNLPANGERIKNYGLSFEALSLESVSAISGAINLLGLLRQDLSYSGRIVEIDRFSLGLALGGKLLAQKSKPCHFSYPAFYPAFEEDLANVDFSALLSSWNDVGSQRERAFRAIHALADAVALMQHSDANYGGGRFALDYSRDHFESADQIFRSLAVKLESPANGTADTYVDLLRMGWLLRSLAKRTDILLVYAKAVSAGGHYRSARSLRQWLGLSPGFSYQGGAVIQFAILSSAGNILDSGNLMATKNGH